MRTEELQNLLAVVANPCYVVKRSRTDYCWKHRGWRDWRARGEAFDEGIGGLNTVSGDGEGAIADLRGIVAGWRRIWLELVQGQGSMGDEVKLELCSWISSVRVFSGHRSRWRGLEQALLSSSTKFSRQVLICGCFLNVPF